CDIFWVVGSSATIATSTSFVGTIMALTSIAMQTGATLNGRALARNGAVTLDTNRIIQSSNCGPPFFTFNFPAPAFVAPPAGNILPASLGVPLELQGQIPWLLLIAVGAGLGATALGVSNRRRRRRIA
ncbi:MAG TPA: ice-binding family protein, partial [Dehalococcoidia bacterium]